MLSKASWNAIVDDGFDEPRPALLSARNFSDPNTIQWYICNDTKQHKTRPTNTSIGECFNYKKVDYTHTHFLSRGFATPRQPRLNHAEVFINASVVLSVDGRMPMSTTTITRWRLEHYTPASMVQRNKCISQHHCSIIVRIHEWKRIDAVRNQFQTLDRTTTAIYHFGIDH